MSKKKGLGFDNVKLNNKGEYIVRFDVEQKKFHFLDDAKEFYEEKHEKGLKVAFWAIIRNIPKLIESKWKQQP